MYLIYILICIFNIQFYISDEIVSYRVSEEMGMEKMSLFELKDVVSLQSTKIAAERKIGENNKEEQGEHKNVDSLLYKFLRPFFLGVKIIEDEFLGFDNGLDKSGASLHSKLTSRQLYIPKKLISLFKLLQV